MIQDEADPKAATPDDARRIFRSGVNRTTSGWAEGYAQCNMLSVGPDVARDLLVFAQRNPKACPVVDIMEPGEYSSPKFSGDIRTDLPGYLVYQQGKPPQLTNDTQDLWQDNYYTFLFGCSFTFENALRRYGIPLRHNEDGRTVPMYRTTIECAPAGALKGPTVVTLRYIPGHLVAEAVRISARYPASHGAPLHIGDPSDIGITNLGTPDWGDPPVSREGDVPVFWACGVTPQAVVMDSRVNFALSHEPGRMAIMDIAEESLLVP